MSVMDITIFSLRCIGIKHPPSQTPDVFGTGDVNSAQRPAHSQTPRDMEPPPAKGPKSDHPVL